MAFPCPNCSQQVESRPIVCPRCGYKSELAREYFWLYGAGALILLSGFLFGGLSTLVVDRATDHWSRHFTGWFPLGPWRPTYDWLSFLIAGIGLSLAGLGITRHRWKGLILFVAIVAWAWRWTLRKLITDTSDGPAPWIAGALIILESAGLLLAGRLALSLRRTPPRELERLQKDADISSNR